MKMLIQKTKLLQLSKIRVSLY